jgi:hypothetical protein
MLKKQKLKKTSLNIMLKIGQSRAFEQANFARMQGNLARSKQDKQSLVIMLKLVKVY